MTSVEEIKRQILAASKAVIPTARGCIYAVGTNLAPYDHLPEDADTHWLELYHQYCDIDPFHPRHFAVLRNSVFRTNDGAGPPEQREAYIKGFRQPMGMSYKAEVFLRDRKHRICAGIRLSRPFEMGEFQDWEIATLQTMQPVFSSAWRAGLTESRLSDIVVLLTKRENEVLECVLAGLSNKQVCLELNLAVPTVKSHVKNILHKTQTTSRSELIAKCNNGK